MPTGSPSTVATTLWVGALDAQAGAPPVLPVAVTLPLGQRRAERVRRVGQRGEAQRAPERPVVGGQLVQLDHRPRMPYRALTQGLQP
jgi:hypothetical protein